MTITSVAYFVVVTRTWKWPMWKAAPLVAVFLIVDLAFLSANMSKLFVGGWVPLTIGALIFAVMTTWIAGRRRLAAHLGSVAFPFPDFLADIERDPPPRVRGTAEFMTANPSGIPPVLFHHYKHNQVLHERVVVLSILSDDTPYVAADKRVHVADLGQGVFQVTAHFGFMETPDVPSLLAACSLQGLVVSKDRITYYLGRETLLASNRPGMMRWPKQLFALIFRNSRSATSYFGIPPNRVVELGMQIEI